MRSAGMTHSAASRSNSAQRAPRTSPALPRCSTRPAWSPEPRASIFLTAAMTSPGLMLASTARPLWSAPDKARRRQSVCPARSGCAIWHQSASWGYPSQSGGTIGGTFGTIQTTALCLCGTQGAAPTLKARNFQAGSVSMLGEITERMLHYPLFELRPKGALAISYRSSHSSQQPVKFQKNEARHQCDRVYSKPSSSAH